VTVDLEPLARWLRCPRCHEALTAIGGLVLGCGTGHRFDANKRGYLSLLGDSKFTGDTAAILDARERFLGRGHYAPIAEAVAQAIPDATGSLLDSGCGTGYYLATALRAHPHLSPLALDVSAAAVARTVAATGAPGLVADVWRPLPVRDSSADALLCIFAPRNPAEFARVLARTGTLVVVTPAPEHLEQLRATGAVIGLQPDKLNHLDESLSGDFSLRSRDELSYTLRLDATETGHLSGMGPSGHHEGAIAPVGGDVTVSVTLSTFSPR